MAIMDSPDKSEPTDTTQTFSFEEGSDVDQENIELNPVVDFVKSEFNRAKDARLTDEQRWLLAYRNYRGLYGPEVQFTSTEKSKAFVKITKTKVLAAYSQIIEVLMAGGKFPIGVEASIKPTGISDAVHVEVKPKEGDPASPKQRRSTAARPEIEKLGAIEKKIEGVEDKVEEGPGQTPTSATFEPAKEAAILMERKMHDQLEESEAGKHLRSFCFELAQFGTGIIKGPFVTDKEYPKWERDGTYNPTIQSIPNINYVSVWNFYPDPDSQNMSDCEFVVERHKMSRTALRNLKKRPAFRKESIENAIDLGADYTPEYWEEVLTDNQTHSDIERYEVLEYWGYIDKDIAEYADLKIPEELQSKDEIQVNIWVCNGQVIRLVLNPFTPNRIPYLATPYEINPYSFFGVGVADNMEDTQLLMNGFMRMAVDNAALSGNLIFEIDENSMATGQDMTLYPGKFFRRTSGAPGQALFSHKINNVTNELFQAFDKSRQLADEATGMPSYAHGQTGIQGIGRTASGISMLMGAAAQNIKAVVRNIDDYLLTPLGRAHFAFNMQFNFDEQFTEGDLEVVARGTESLMRNEIRSQKLMQFQQVAQNPMMAPLVKWDYILREFAKTLDLDPEKLINDPREAIVQATRMAGLNQALGAAPPGAPAGAAPQGGPPAPSDPTGNGGGNIGPGASPEPGADGFSGPPLQ
tara:strand:- start:792 stop:2873 length:2082 start_codon:yes stop_codon:yes gene_type:complete